VLTDARQALGGEAVLSGIRSLLIAGSRSPRPQACGGRVQVAFEAPDKFARLAWNPSPFHYYDECEQPPQTVTAEWIREGFVGDAPFYEGLAPRVGADFHLQTPEQFADERGSFYWKHLATRYLFPLFASSFALYPMEFAHAGRQTKGGKLCDAIDARGPDGFVVRLFVDRKTHLPAMLTWTVPMPGTVLGPPAILPPPAAAQVEYQMSIEGYKRENGVNWPHRFRIRAGRTLGIVEDIWDLKFMINPAIDPETFRISK
jgi:hypothetical protein